MSAVLLALKVGNLLAILLVLFVPGYVLVAALFPKNKEIDWIERIALSFGLSIAVVPLLGLLLNFTPFGIRFAPILATIAIFTGGVGYVAYRQRMRLPTDRRLSMTVNLAVPDWKEYNALDKGLTIALAASVIVAAGSLAYVVTTQRPRERFSEFYVLGAGGNASGYPTRLNVSEPGTVILGIMNHESAIVNYTVRVDLVGVNVVFNASCNCNQTQEVNRTSRAWLNRSLGDAENWTQRYKFWINATGLWKLEFLLYKDAILTVQKLHLFVRVL
jgi:uncharacterized membrane protein